MVVRTHQKIHFLRNLRCGSFIRKLWRIAWMLVCLPPAALILWNTDKKALAVEIMALAFTHPKNQQGWFVKSPLGEHALENMKSGLGEHAYDEGWQRGTQRNLHETTAALLAIFTT